MPETIYPLQNSGCHSPETPEALSPDNSSKTLLGISASFVGGGILTANLIAFTVLVETDKDGTLKLQSSPDDSVWNTDRTIALNAANNRKVIENINIQDTYFRIVYDNGGTAQTTFRLQTVSHRNSSIQDIILQRIIGGEFNSLKVGALTSGRVVFVGASRVLADNSLFVWDGSKLGVGIAVPKKTLHCAKDGINPSILLLENSRPNSAGSIDETVRLTFGFGGKTNAVLLIAYKEKDFTELAKESAGFSIHTRKDGVTSEAIQIGADGSVKLVRGTIGVNIAPDANKGIFVDVTVDSDTSRYALQFIQRAIDDGQGDLFGVSGSVSNIGSTALPANIHGIAGQAIHGIAGTIASVRGIDGTADINAGATATEAYGLYADVNIAGIATASGAGFFKHNGINGSGSNRYGIYAQLSGAFTTGGGGIAAAGRFDTGPVNHALTAAVWASVQSGATANTVLTALAGIDFKGDAKSYACQLVGKLGWSSGYNASPDVVLLRSAVNILQLASGDNFHIVDGILTIGGDLKHTGTKSGFYGTAPIVKQTGVAVTVAGIHAALVNLGFISA